MISIIGGIIAGLGFCGLIYWLGYVNGGIDERLRRHNEREERAKRGERV